jgi:hypothetical protein
MDVRYCYCKLEVLVAPTPSNFFYNLRLPSRP